MSVPKASNWTPDIFIAAGEVLLFVVEEGLLSTGGVARVGKVVGGWVAGGWFRVEHLLVKREDPSASPRR